ncbi:hypothetical protein HDU85_003956 [Gaertneriomyces sp. JEL0708]|nr:hypothetical protein HDU85_003956 [Gaertneriomyces sp. JEL0708]
MASSSTSPAKSSKFKISLTAVLNDEHDSPFSLADFEKFVQKEHSEENLEFWFALMRYRANASMFFHTKDHSSSSLLRYRRTNSHISMRSYSSAFNSTTSLSNRPHLPSSVHTSNSVNVAGSEDNGSEEDLEKIKEEAEMLVTLYMTPGSDKEVNLPASVRKKALLEVNEKKNYHPDVFKNVMEHVYYLMKNSTYPNFYRQSVAYLRQHNLPFPERRMKETIRTPELTPNPTKTSLVEPETPIAQRAAKPEQ